MAGGAQPGNNNGTKIKDVDLRQKAYQQYCAWIARGKSAKSFKFVEGDLECTFRTVESYIKDNPVEFPPIKKELAKADSLARWEKVVEESAEGINEKANTATLQMLMRNKFGWDKPDVTGEDTLYALEKMKEFFKTIS